MIQRKNKIQRHVMINCAFYNRHFGDNDFRCNNCTDPDYRRCEQTYQDRVALFLELLHINPMNFSARERECFFMDTICLGGGKK